MTGLATTVEAVTVPDAGASGDGAGRGRTVVGTGSLVRFVLRRDRVRLVVWFGAIVGMVVLTAASITGLYNTPEQLASYGRTVRGNSPMIFQAGPGYGLDNPTLGAVMMNEVGMWTFIAVGLMSVFMMVRHTRAGEESEQAELIRAAPVGRNAPLAAALVGTGIAVFVVAAGCVLTFVAYGLPASGSLAFGASTFGAGLVFAGVAAVSAQIASGARAALALGGIVLGASFVMRAIGDIGNGVLTWLSPIGWAQSIRAFADERWWVLVLPLLTAAGLVAVSVALQGRRDFGAGLIEPRPGAAAAAPGLSSPLGLAVRLQRASVLGWAVGLGLLAFFYGIVADQAESFIEENPEMEHFFAQLGKGSVTDAFLSLSVLVMALMATGFTISSVLRLRSEEVAGRTDVLLATPVPRRALALSHLGVALVGTVLMMLVCGAAIGVGFAIVIGDAGQVARVVAACLVMVPAMWVFAGLALALYGLAPKLSPVVWALFVWALIAGMLASVLNLPDWVIDLSPFQHVPGLPAAPMSWGPVVVLLVIASALMAVGLWALDRRDMS
jgi:polyether ionophore transport system permease protein